MSGGRWVLRGARLIDGVGPPRTDATVVIDGERISRVAPDPAVESRPDDRIVDLSGRTLMPGMFSCRFHSSWEGVSPGAAPVAGLHAPPAYMALTAGRNARLALECGITGVIGSSVGYGIDASLKQAIEDGLVPGPRVLAGSHQLCATGDLPTGAAHGWHMQLGNLGVVRTGDGVAALQRLVREEIKQGADVVELRVGSGRAAGAPPSGPTLTCAELEAAVRVAHQRGRRVRAHATSREAFLACARAGVDLIDRVGPLDDECIDAILERDLTIVPSAMSVARTLALYDAERGASPLAGPVAPRFEDTDRTLRAHLENVTAALPRAVAAGVRIVSGDDYGTAWLSHGEYAAEYAYYVDEVGLAPLEVLRCATLAGAEAMGRADVLGSIEAGKLADLVVVDGDPSTDIRCLQDTARIELVMKGGVVQKGAPVAA
jgi:imidazolonepropionase-like amidohydrolase